MEKKHQKFNTMGRPNVGDWTSSRGESIGKELKRESNWRDLNWRGTTVSSKKVIKGVEKEEVLSVDKRSNPETRPDKRLKTPKKAT